MVASGKSSGMSALSVAIILAMLQAVALADEVDTDHKISEVTDGLAQVLGVSHHSSSKLDEELSIEDVRTSRSRRRRRRRGYVPRPRPRPRPQPTPAPATVPPTMDPTVALLVSQVNELKQKANRLELANSNLESGANRLEHHVMELQNELKGCCHKPTEAPPTGGPYPTSMPYPTGGPYPTDGPYPTGKPTVTCPPDYRQWDNMMCSWYSDATPNRNVFHLKNPDWLADYCRKEDKCGAYHIGSAENSHLIPNPRAVYKGGQWSVSCMQGQWKAKKADGLVLCEKIFADGRR